MPRKKKVPGEVSAYMSALARKANRKMSATKESREAARDRAAKAREALKRKREAAKATLVAPAVPSVTNPPVWTARFEPKEAGK